ncbi:uncharacterized protein LOC142336488 isoform X2 [Convolutriloba macropyga]
MSAMNRIAKREKMRSFWKQTLSASCRDLSNFCQTSSSDANGIMTSSDKSSSMWDLRQFEQFEIKQSHWSVNIVASSLFLTLDEISNGGADSTDLQTNMDPAEIESKPIKIESMRKKWDQVFHFALKENELQQRQNEVFEEMKNRKTTSQWSMPNGSVANRQFSNSSLDHLPIEKRPTCDRIEIVPQNDADESIRVRSRTLEWNQRINAVNDGSQSPLGLDRSLNAGSSNATSPIIVESPKKFDSPQKLDNPVKIDSPKKPNDSMKLDSPKQFDCPQKLDSPVKLDSPKKLNGSMKIESPKQFDSPQKLDSPKKADVLMDMRIDKSKERERIKFQELEQKRKLRSQKGNLSAIESSSSGFDQPGFGFLSEPKHVTIQEKDDTSGRITITSNGEINSPIVTKENEHKKAKEVIEIIKIDPVQDSQSPVAPKTKKKIAPPPPPASHYMNGHANHMHVGKAQVTVEKL